LKRKIVGKSAQVALDCLIQVFSGDRVNELKIGIEDDALAA
jgi:hypothetical protein